MDGNETYVYDNEDHNCDLVSMLKMMYDNELLVDVTLVVQDREFKCHRNVLAAVSAYFKAMFSCDLSEKRKSKVTLYELDAEAVGLIVEYAYTGKIEIDKNNAQNLMASSSLFQINEVQKACAEFMASQLDTTNCVGIHCFARVHDCQDLVTKSQEYIEKNFSEVYLGEEFQGSSFEMLKALMKTSELNVESEEVVYDALLRWISFDKDARQQYFEELFTCIRLNLLTTKFMKNIVLREDMVQKSKKCGELIETNLKLLEEQAKEEEPEMAPNLRSGMIKPDLCVLLIGGVDRRVPSINCYNPLTKETFYLADFPDREGRTGCYDVEVPACVVTPENQIFVAGGNYIYRESFLGCLSDDGSYDGDDETVRRDVYLYDNDHNSWIPKAPMLFPKSNFCLAYCEGRLYCFGGLTVHQHPTEIIESYDIAFNKWNYVGMMPTKLVDLSAVTVCGVIFIMGGRTGVGAHNVLMSFDPRKNHWTSLAGIPTPRFNFGTCVINKEIWLAGGQIYSHSSHTINREALSSVEIYNIELNQWRNGPELPVTLYNVGLCHIGHYLYACGTTEYQRASYRIFRYNVVYRLALRENIWSRVEIDLCDTRDFVCVAATLHTRKLSQVLRPEPDAVA